MKRLISLLLALTLLLSTAAAYTDVPQGAYYEKTLSDLTAAGVVEESETFRPNDACTRAQFVTWLHNLAGKPAPKESVPFTDVPSDAAFAKAVAWAREVGVTTGKTETLFGTEDTVTRAQMVTFLHRYAQTMAYTGTDNTASLSAFLDKADVPAYAEAPLSWAVAIGMVKGNTDGTVTPNAPATRAHAIAFLGRIQDSQPPVTWDVDGDGELSILSIGNSYSCDAHEYIGAAALALGVPKVYTVSLYVSGCKLSQHAEFLDTDTKDYAYHVHEGAEGERRGKVDLIDALKERSWDYITLQQGSSRSFRPETYNEDLTKVVSFVRGNAPNSKFAWHMTWAYSYEHTNSSFKTYFDQDQMKMYAAICSTVQEKIVEPNLFDAVIPTGTAVQNARSSKLGDTLNRDGTHLTYDIGCYIAALTFLKALTGLAIDDIPYTPAPGTALHAGKETKYEVKAMTTEEKAIAIESVNNAIETPFAITQSVYTK